MLTIRTKFEIAAVSLALVAIAIFAGAWRGAHNDAAKLKVTLATEQLVVADASKREADRDAQLKTTVAALEEAKKRVQSPTQVLRALPAVIPLPEPIAASVAARAPGNPPPKGTPEEVHQQSATIPAADLKPLYDFGVACQECKARVATLTKDRADDALKLGAVEKQRDAAVAAAKGGSKFARIKRAAKFIVIGAVAGAAALCGSGHCK